MKTLISKPKKKPVKPLKMQRGVEDLLGQPSGKFDYKVFYSKPPLYDIPIKSIVPGGWGDEFDDDKPASKEDQTQNNHKRRQRKKLCLLTEMSH